MKTKKSQQIQQLVEEIKTDFAARQQMRRPYELAWQLNMNFVNGNQYCEISPLGLTQQDKNYYWQEKQVFNHIAPIVETRLARLSNVRPKMMVRPSSNSDADIKTAELSTKILSSATETVCLDKLICQATAWSEICGTAFYKVIWNGNAGVVLQYEGQTAKCGEVEVAVCSPFEIYPDSNVAGDVEACNSIIHAKAVSVDEIFSHYGKRVAGEDVKIFSSNNTSVLSGYGYNSTVPAICEETKSNHAVVIERYTKPDTKYPNGRLEIVAGDVLLYEGDLPYYNVDGVRDFPFVRQVSLTNVGCFWGASIVDRVIPLQRSYNAVKNRKHEFLNRISVGVLSVEDGSVDIDNLEEEGLSPGKVITYRSGCNKPTLLDSGDVPADFSYEEDRLLNEFIVISGVSELARNSTTPTNVTSGVALQLLIEQDETRLQSTTNEVREAIKKIGKLILRLYKQYATVERLAKTVTESGSIELNYFNSSDLRSDDIVFETENQLSDSVANRRNIVLQLLSAGLLFDDKGKLTETTKIKVLSMLGFGNWENAQDVAQLHQKRAERENQAEKLDKPLDIDDHDIHIQAHTAFVIAAEQENMSVSRKNALLEHIAQHKAAATVSTLLEGQQ